LDTPHADSNDRSDWCATVSASSTDGEFYIGVDEELVFDPADMLRRAYEIAKGMFDVRYGFAYKMPLVEDPACYASGFRRTSLADFRDLLRRRREGIERQKTPDDLWHDELMEGRDT